MADVDWGLVVAMSFLALVLVFGGLFLWKVIALSRRYNMSVQAMISYTRAFDDMATDMEYDALANADLAKCIDDYCASQVFERPGDAELARMGLNECFVILSAHAKMHGKLVETATLLRKCGYTSTALGMMAASNTEVIYCADLLHQVGFDVQKRMDELAT